MELIRRWSLVVSLVAAVASLHAQAPPTPELTQPVNDFARVIDAQSSTEMERIMRALDEQTTDAIVVVTVPSLEGFTGIEELAVKLFENHGRGIGRKGKDNGVLIVVAPKDRKVRIEVGYDLEKWITDGYAGETIREFMAPAFRRQAYGEGLLAAVTRIAGRIARERGVTLTALQQPDRPRRDSSGDSGYALTLIVVIFILVALLSRGGGGRGRRTRYWGGGGWSGWSSGVGPFGGGWSS